MTLNLFSRKMGMFLGKIRPHLFMNRIVLPLSFMNNTQEIFGIMDFIRILQDFLDSYCITDPRPQFIYRGPLVQGFAGALTLANCRSDCS
jgi:hypothetical protein